MSILMVDSRHVLHECPLFAGRVKYQMEQLWDKVVPSEVRPEWAAMSAVELMYKLMHPLQWVGSPSLRLFKVLVLGMFLQQVKCYDEYHLLSSNLSMSDTVDDVLGL